MRMRTQNDGDEHRTKGTSQAVKSGGRRLEGLGMGHGQRTVEAPEHERVGRDFLLVSHIELPKDEAGAKPSLAGVDGRNRNAWD